MEADDLTTTKISLPMEHTSANQAEEFLRSWSERCELEGKILFRLVFVVNEIVASIVQLSKVVGVTGNIEIEVITYTRQIVVNITFPDSIPLDPTFNHSDELLDEFPGMKLLPDIFWHHALLKWVDKATWSKSWKKTTISLIQHARLEEKAGELYFLSLKPKLADELKLSYLPGDSIVAKTPDMETALRLGPQESFVLRSIDGKTAVREIYYSFIQKFGLIHPQTFGSLIENLIERRIIVTGDRLIGFQKEKSKIKKIIEKVFKLRYTIPNADSYVETLIRRIGWLWSIRASFIYFLFLLGSVIFFIFHLSSIQALTIKYFTGNLLLDPYVWIGFYLGMAINIIPHEFSHAIVCKKFGGKVHGMGIMFYYASPCAFADTTDAWMFKNKWHRVMVSLAGPLCTLILSFIFAWCWFLCMRVESISLSLWSLSMKFSLVSLGLIFGAVFVVGILSVFINLFPFIETDGYYMLMDILEIPNLRKKSFSYFSSFLKKGSKPQVTKKEAVIFIIYSILAVGSIFALLLILVDFIMARLAKYGGVFSWILASLLVVLFFERLIKGGISWYKRKYLAPMDLKVETK